MFKRGDLVQKVTGDYKFYGVVVCVFYKLGGTKLRFVVENEDGILHIFSEFNLERQPSGEQEISR